MTLYADSEYGQTFIALGDMRACPYRKCKHVHEVGVVVPTGLPYPTNVMISGGWAFHMKDTHGIEPELFNIMIEDKVRLSLPLDEATFDALLQEQRERAREDSRRKKVGITMGKGFDNA